MTNPRDRSVDALLARGMPAAPPPPGQCLDPESAAAWFDGTLRADERAAADAHAAACPRCQALLATMARIDPVEPAGHWWERLPMRWLVPATAGAAAVALWIAVVPHEPSIVSSPTPASDVSPAVVDKAPADAADKKADTPPAATKPATPQRELQDSRERRAQPSAPAPEAPPAARQDAPRSEAKTLRKMTAPPAGNSVARFGDAAGLQENVAAAPVVVRSPDSAVQWRTAGAAAVVERTIDGGATWVSQPIGGAVVVTAGASPSRDVVWLVGAGGVVLLSTNGKTWQRRNVGEAVNLSAVRAADDRTATVTAADGREFTTHDAGLTWSPARLQELPAAPF